ncbi:aspartate aminotransferase family protein [Phreatobacter stygius]|uniref:Aspartate aminotransferase family protein n=1 Tax=Phreatobacter stygius TaxID=1940610 RepID=A0A4D7B8N5_9HYPH|nr:aspartate aminotransferase family protein [Phreatobacter stygius]QCI65936.1 aspartate aminotransferase family protein [Phreatobacter stygius]
MNDIGHRWLNQHKVGERLPKAVGGEGIYVIDETGRRYLDGSSGPALFCLGHGHREVIEAIKAQYDKLSFGYSANFTSDPIDELAETIIDQAGGGMSRVSFVSGGSEATETAMKIALQYHLARGHSGRTHFFARRQSWHGYTFGALSLSGHPARRKPYAAALMPVTHLSPANAYRPPAGVAPDELAEHLAAEFEREIHRVGAEHVAALFFEPVVGAAGGAVPAPEGYARKMREICTRYGILMIADEVMCGVGRCGTWRALAHDGVAPDVMYTAKGLAGGYAPLGAALMTEEVYRTIADVFGTIASVHTYSGHTAACAAGLAVQKVIIRDGLVEKCRTDGDYLMGALREAFGQNPHVGDIRGRGFFVALELVRDRETKAPFAAALGVQAKIKEEAFSRGLLCYPSPGTADGYNGDHVILAPPYIISRAEIDQMVETLKAATTAALARVAS